MAEPAPTEVYDSFCTERDSLEATIVTLEAAPTLANLDTLSAAKVRLDLVQNAIPGLCQAKDTYEADLRAAAILAVQAPRWSDAATAKVAALDDVRSSFIALREAVQAYRTAHGIQQAALMALGYSREYRARHAVAVDSLTQIINVVLSGDGTWMSKLTTFDSVGVTTTLPYE